MSQTIVLIQNPDVVIPVDALKYLEHHSKYKLIFYTSDLINVDEIIRKHYQAGVRKFILSLFSSELQDLSKVFTDLKDAKFVATISTLISLRGQFNNLYFTLPSDTYINPLINIALPYNVVMVYDNLENSYIREVVSIFQSAGVPVFDVNNLEWTNYPVLGLIGLSNDLWAKVYDHLQPTRNYVIGALEIFPANDLILKPNIKGSYVYLPLSTTVSQINSYWNLINANPAFTAMGTANNVTPLLTNVSWSRLIKSQIISTNLQTNGFNLSLYKSNLNITLKYNRINHNVPPCANYIWIIEAQYIDTYLLNNSQYLSNHIDTLKKIVISTDVNADVCKYWTRGSRNFILEAPSDTVAKVQRHKYPGAFFLCTRATDPKLRKAQSQYVFSLLDDNTMIETSLNSFNVGSLGKVVCVMGRSNNIDIPGFKAQLSTYHIQYVDDVTDIPADTLSLFSVGNDEDFANLVRYLIEHKDRLPALKAVYQYGSYSNQTQIDVLNSLGFVSYPVINRNSSQPFLDSEYSMISRPLYLSNLTNFLYLSNILFQWSPKLLFDFGYYIDVDS